MDLPTKDLVDLLTFLLPGFVAAAIVHNLTPTPRPSPFERVVQALIFTVILQAGTGSIEQIASTVGGRFSGLAAFIGEARPTISLAAAILFGLVLARVSNHDSVHSLLRRLRITHQTSYHSEWYGALSQNRGYAVLHLGGERRLYGWPEEWPNTPDRGHFVIAEPQWLDANGRVTEAVGVRRILVRATEVEMVELMAVDPQGEAH